MVRRIARCEIGAVSLKQSFDLRGIKERRVRLSFASRPAPLAPPRRRRADFDLPNDTKRRIVL
jgi:hypothetical protein